jgi:hypothetical protein
MTNSQQVLSEIIAGDALGLSAAARIFPAHRGEGRASSSTVWRWINTGTRTSNGRVVKLEAARIGTRWLTSKAAISRYMAALTPVADGTPHVPSLSGDVDLNRARAAMKKLTNASG